MATNVNRVFRSELLQTQVNESGSVATAALLPGITIAIAANGNTTKAAAAAGAPVYVSIENLANAGDVDATFAVGETPRYVTPRTGDKGFLRVAAGTATIAARAVVETDADGKAATLAAGRGIAVALEALDNSGGAVDAWVEVEYL